MTRLPIVTMCPAGFERVVATIAERELAPFERSQLGSCYVRATTARSVASLYEDAAHLADERW